MLKFICPAVLLLTGCGLLPAVELNCVFDRELPDAVTVAGDTRREDGAAVRVNVKNYVAAIIRFQGESSASGTLELDLKTIGQPPTRLGVILYRRNAERALERISTPAWLKAVPIDSFGLLTFSFPAGTFKSGTEYRIYIYRANQKGTLIFRRITFKTARTEKSITLNYRNTPDLVGPVTRGPSGKPDFHIHLTGVDPAKSIREVVVTRPGGRWVSGDDVKKNFWMIDYYDSADFPARKNPRNNFDGAVHSGLSCIDLVMEGGYSEGASYLCEVFYADGSKDTWTAALKKPDPPMTPLFFSHKQPILAAPSFALPEGWKQPVISGKTYFQMMSPRGKLDRGLLMQGKTHRRVWSLGWFLPFAGMNRNPSRAQIEKYVKWSRRAALREFQVFDAGGQQLGGATVTGGGPKWLDLEKVIDGDTSPDSAAKAEKNRINQPQEAEITLTFPHPVKLSKAVLHHGCRNGSQIGWTARNFVLDSLQDGKWTAVPGCEVRNNKKDRTEHALNGIETTALRLRIQDENPLADYGIADWSADNVLLDLKKTEKIPEDVTFHYWYLGHDSRLHYALPPDGFTPPGMDKYRKWRAAHPNFMGFQLAEFDNDLLCMLGWGSYRDQKGAKAVYDSAGKQLVIQRPIPKLPDTRTEAVAQYEHIFKFYQHMMFNDCANFSSLTIWHHHPMEWGAVSTVMECFGGCPVFSMQIAAARGASRQYGNKPWGCYYATYLGHGHLNYLKSNDSTFGPDCGKSASLYRRQLYYGYLTGVTYVDYEHADIAFVTKKFVKGQQPELSPHGKAVLEAAEFAERDPERGHVYTPVAVLMDWENGWNPHEERKIWMGMFKPTLGDRNIDVWMKGIFGNSEMPQEGYGCNMSQTGFSALADILMLNPPGGPPRNLADYPAAIVIGSIRWNAGVIEAVRDHVRNGGILIINSEQLPEVMDSGFTGVELTGKSASGTETLTMDDRKLTKAARPYEYRQVRLKGASVLLQTPDRQPLATVFQYGRGKVVLTLQKYLMEEPASAGQKQGLPAIHYLLSLLRQELLPFQVRGDSPAEVVAARLKNGWRVSLLNNRGVYKQATTAPIIVTSEKTVQTVSFPGRIESVTERISGKTLPVKTVDGRDQVTVTIPAGDLAVLDFAVSSK